MARPSTSTSISACINRMRRCPVHGAVISRRRAHTVMTPTAAKSLIPSMQDLVLWKWDKITMAMSGGVDSAVALRILSEMPVDINVIFMRNWDSTLSENNDDAQPTSYAYSSYPSSSKTQPQSPCGWQRDWEMVQKVCAHVGIPEHRIRLVDLSKEYWTRVFEPALSVWENGGTPNPDVACNREIKFGALMRHIPKAARSFLATGHYARVKRVPHATRLCRADDLNKDQSYYLSAITEAQLRRAIFPLERLTKEDTRKLAKYYGLPNAEKEESMGLCFVGERGRFSNFISQYLPKPPTQGHLVDKDGKRLAPHDGLWSLTVGQRAKIHSQVEPLFVARKGVGESGQDILVVPGMNNPALLCTRIHTHDFHWIAGKTPSGIVPGGHKRAWVQIRHRMEPVSAVISHDWNGGGLTVDFLEPVHGVAPGQVCAIYYMKWCLGSGVIKQTWTADTHPIRTFKEIKQDEDVDYFGAEEVERLVGKRAGRHDKGDDVVAGTGIAGQPVETVTAERDASKQSGHDIGSTDLLSTTITPKVQFSATKKTAEERARERVAFDPPPPLTQPLSEEERSFASLLTAREPTGSQTGWTARLDTASRIIDAPSGQSERGVLEGEPIVGSTGGFPFRRSQHNEGFSSRRRTAGQGSFTRDTPKHLTSTEKSPRSSVSEEPKDDLSVESPSRAKEYFSSPRKDSFVGSWKERSEAMSRTNNQQSAFGNRGGDPASRGSGVSSRFGLSGRSGQAGREDNARRLVDREAVGRAGRPRFGMKA